MTKDTVYNEYLTLLSLKTEVRYCLFLPAVYSDWSVLSKLFLGFVNLPNEVNEALSSFWHSLLRPVSELKLADCSGLSILQAVNI